MLYEFVERGAGDIVYVDPSTKGCRKNPVNPKEYDRNNTRDGVMLASKSVPRRSLSHLVNAMLLYPNHSTRAK